MEKGLIPQLSNVKLTITIVRGCGRSSAFFLAKKTENDIHW